MNQIEVDDVIKLVVCIYFIFEKITVIKKYTSLRMLKIPPSMNTMDKAKVKIKQTSIHTFICFGFLLTKTSGFC